MLLPEEGWQFEDQNDYEKAMALDQYCEFNKRKGVTHTSSGRVDYSSEHSGNTEFSSHFCFPLDY
jgi:hypothetical protein